MTAGRRLVLAPWAVLGGFALAVAASFAYLRADFGALFSVEALGQMTAFSRGFIPPDMNPAFLRQVAHGAVGT